MNESMKAESNRFLANVFANNVRDSSTKQRLRRFETHGFLADSVDSATIGWIENPQQRNT